MSKKILHTDHAPAAIGTYSQAVRHGDLVFLSGQIPLVPATMELVGEPVPLLEPQEQYELTGTVDNVIFPTGLLFCDGSGCGIKSRDTRIALYYGAADRAIHVGLTTVGRLIDAALGKYQPLAKC